MGRLIRRALIASVVVLSLLLAAGFGYERIARAGDNQRYPPPGELIEAGIRVTGGGC